MKGDRWSSWNCAQVEVLALRMWPSVLMVLLCLQGYGATDSFSVVVSPTPVSAHLGGSATLPCWLSPAVSAEALEIRWYRPDKFLMPVLFYRERKVQQSPQDPQYEGRVSLSSRSPTTGGLKEGDVSLFLQNVALSDNGKFECYVSSDKMYESGVVDLQVNVLGTPPAMSSGLTSDGTLNVSCASSGWHPKPALAWEDSKGSILPPGGVQYRVDPSGLLFVHSWILAPPTNPDWLSCTVSIPDGARQEGRLSVKDTLYSCSDFTLPWRAAFFCVVLLAIAGTLIWLFGKRDTLRRKFSSKSMKSKCLLSAVYITLDPSTAHSSLKLSKNNKALRDKNEIDSGSEYRDEMYVLGQESFISGTAYWEVVLKQEKTVTKKMWGMGVMSKRGKKYSSKPLICSKGFWVLSLHDGQLHVSTDTPVAFPLEEEPQKLGIFLNYDKGHLKFFDVEREKLLLTLSAKFTGAVYPLFNPGIGDEAPLMLSSGDTEKSNGSNLCTRDGNTPEKV
ncbi:butyrophilin subfamily 2 member A1-like [Arapaima gigas]